MAQRRFCGKNGGRKRCKFCSLVKTLLRVESADSPPNSTTASSCIGRFRPIIVTGPWICSLDIYIACCTDDESRSGQDRRLVDTGCRQDLCKLWPGKRCLLDSYPACPVPCRWAGLMRHASMCASSFKTVPCFESTDFKNVSEVHVESRVGNTSGRV